MACLQIRRSNGTCITKDELSKSKILKRGDIIKSKIQSRILWPLLSFGFSSLKFDQPTEEPSFKAGVLL